MNIIGKIYHNPIFENVFKTVVYTLKKELADCETVLDLGCGPDSPLQYCTNVKRSIGVEAFGEYVERSKKKGIHTEYVQDLIENIKFEPKTFDAVIMIEVLEHMSEEAGREAIKKCELWAKKKVIITTPNGFIEQQAIDDNKLQRHLSGWTPKMFRELGFRLHGLAGLKSLRAEKDEDTMDDNILVSIKYRPKLLWFVVATISQVLTYYMPKLAFELFAVKEL